MLAISIPAFFYADTWGRRTSALSGGVVLSGCMLLIGSLYAAEIVHAYGIARWVVIVSIFIFALTYSLTWNIVAKIYASEIQPAQTRATANSIATGSNFVCVPYRALGGSDGIVADALYSSQTSSWQC